MTSVDGHTGSFGDSSTGTPAREYSPRFSKWRVLQLVLATVFFITAFLKWRAFVASVPSTILEVAPQLEWGLIQFEIFLAIWLISGLATSLVWWVLLTAFASFAGSGIYQVWIGQSSCGCFGELSINPIWVVTFDLGVLLLLSYISPQEMLGTGSETTFIATGQSKLKRYGVLFVTMIGIVAGIFIMASAPTLTNIISTYSSPSLTGQYLVTKPVVSSIGVSKPGQWVEFTLQVNNRSNEAIKLIGAINDCQCVAGPDLPSEIPPGAGKNIRFRVKIGDTLGRRDGRIWIRTNHPQQPFLLCRWRGHVEN